VQTGRRIATAVIENKKVNFDFSANDYRGIDFITDLLINVLHGKAGVPRSKSVTMTIIIHLVTHIMVCYGVKKLF
jgi:hypothetical protein